MSNPQIYVMPVGPLVCTFITCFEDTIFVLFLYKQTHGDKQPQQTGN